MLIKGKNSSGSHFDLKLILVQMRYLIFLLNMRKLLERRINIIPCEYYVEKADITIDKLQSEKKEIFLYLMYVYQQIKSRYRVS